MDYSPEGIVVLWDGPTGRRVKILPQKLFYRVSRPAHAAEHTAEFNLFVEAGSAFLYGLLGFKIVCY